MTTGIEPPLLLIGGAGGIYGGRGMACGAGVWAIVTTAGWQAVTVLVTVRRVRFILRAGSPFLTTRDRIGSFFDIFFT